MKTPAALRPARALLAALLALASAHAQISVTPPPAGSTASRAPGAADDGSSSLALSSVASALSSGLPLIRRGPVAVRPHLQYRFLSGSGIEAGPGNLRDTSIQSVSPGVLVEIGEYWEFDYTPTWTYYSSEAFRDTFDQSARLSGRYSGRAWSLGGSQSYESIHVLLVETGRQTHQEKYTTSLGAAWQVGRRTSLEAGVTRSVRYANALTAAPEWTTSDWLQYTSHEWVRYRVSPRLNFAGGLGLGRAEVSVGDDMTFLQPQAQLMWQPTGKISISGQGGVEYRRFSRRARAPLETPLYSATLSYRPVPTTRLRVDASRLVSASYFANELTRERGWSAGLEQRLLRHLFLDVSYSTNRATFLPVRASARPRREDRYRAFGVRLSTVVFKRGVVSAVYHHGRNVSALRQYEFVTDQFGAELSYRF